VVIAHLLTGTRLLLVAPFALWMAREDATLPAALAIVVAIVTDLLDGPAARRAGGGASPWGRAFDHGTDFLFVTVGLFAMASRGASSFWLPALICVAFAQYALDSWMLHRQRELRMSSLGRWNGILYFVPLCADVFSRVAGGVLHAPIQWLCWALAASTLLSIVDRLISARAARGSRA
jgi:phosphatidylglycerophosphate synthase